LHLFDTAQCVLDGVQRGRLALVPLVGGQVQLQLFQQFNHLLLGLGFGRLLTTAGCTITQQQILQPDIPPQKSEL